MHHTKIDSTMKKEDFKHTPGPWAIGEKSDSRVLITSDADGQEWHIAGVYGFIDRGLGDDEEYNAALIASAPELLELLFGLFNSDNVAINDGSLADRIELVIKKATNPTF